MSPPEVANNYFISQMYRIIKEPGRRSRYSDSLLAGRSGDQIPVRSKYSAPFQTGSEAHPASCKMGTVSFPLVKAGEALC